MIIIPIRDLRFEIPDRNTKFGLQTCSQLARRYPRIVVFSELLLSGNGADVGIRFANCLYRSKQGDP